MASSAPQQGESLKDQYPIIADEWHPVQNGELSPADVKPGSHKKVWWSCGTCKHEWEAVIKNRTGLGRGCPLCSKRRVAEKLSRPRMQPSGLDSSLQTKEPLIAATWHPSKNLDLTPSDVYPSSGRMVWWLGICGHEWRSTVANRTAGFGCAVCKGKQVQHGLTDLESQFPDIATEWHQNRNDGLLPKQVTTKSNKKVWWRCLNGHEWSATVNNRVSKGSGCPYCAGQRLILGENDLATVDPDLARQWHPTRNGDLLPSGISSANRQQVWWLCDQGHEWKTSVGTRSRGRGCPACARHGFNPKKDAWLYLVFNDELDMNQIGITNDPKSRLAVHRRNGWEIVDLRGPMPGDLARDLESRVLSSLSLRGALLGTRRGPNRFDGFTEAWSSDSLKVTDISQLMGWIHDDDESEHQG